jgi:hypothetical protein
VLICGNEASRPPRCYKQNLPAGAPTAITPEGVVGVRISSDGQYLAYRDTGRDSGGEWKILTFADNTVRPIPGLRPDYNVVAWATDGKSLFAAASNEIPAPLYRIDVRTGSRTLIKELAPADRTALNLIWVTSVIDDARGYAYGYSRVSAQLYLMQGLDD